MRSLTAVLTIAAIAIAATGASAETTKKSGVLKGELVLFKQQNYDGARYQIDQDTTSVSLEWNIGSIGIHEGDKWEICAKSRFREPCMMLTDSVPVAADIGIMGGIGSARQVK